MIFERVPSECLGKLDSCILQFTDKSTRTGVTATYTKTGNNTHTIQLDFKLLNGDSFSSPYELTLVTRELSAFLFDFEDIIDAARRLRA